MKNHRSGTVVAGLTLLLAFFLGGCGSATTTPVTPVPTASLQASTSQVTAGQSVTLTWTSTNATSISIDPSVSATALPMSGSASVSPAATTTYKLTATGAGGSASSTVTVTVSAPAPAPTVTLTANPTTIAAGATSTLTWTSTNATSVSIDNGVGAGAVPNGTATVTPAATTTYTITATSGAQTATATATVTVTASIPKSEISHLIVVIMQNHSFDHLFETFPGANGAKAGDPGYSQADASGTLVSPTLLTSLASADQTVDPAHDNAHYTADYDGGAMDGYAKTEGAYSMQYYDKTSSGTTKDGKTFSMATIWDYAQQYALADNFFASAMYSEPANMLYLVSATVHDPFTAGKLPAYDKCDANQVGGKIAPALTETTVGDQMNAAKISWTWYQGGYSTSVDGTCVNYVPQENPFQYFTSTQYSTNLQDFNLATFQTTLTNGSLPSVSFITPPPGSSMHPGSGDVSNGIEWLDGLVNLVKNSPEWPSTAIVLLWDESGGWYDHVPPPQLANSVGLGARVPVIVISPFAKAGTISHTQMDFVSVLRFIQWNWALGTFTDAAQAAREQQSGDICDLLLSTCAAP
jgi:phospholipase C